MSTETDAAGETPQSEKKKEMRAIVLTGFGGLKAVRVLNKPEPTAGPGDVIIRVMACGLNFQDLMARQGALDAPPRIPFIMGFECAGVVEAVARDDGKLKVGDRVVAFTDYKAWAELVPVREDCVFRIPDKMTFHDAAAIAMNFCVAYILLFELGNLSPHKSILLHSAGGGVGHAVVQLSRTVEDVKIIGIASQGKHDALQGLKIDNLIERGTDYTVEVRKICPDGVDIVLDCLCGEDSGRGYSLLKPMGKYILYGTGNVVTGETKSIFSAARSWWHVDKYSPLKLFDENKSLCGFNLRHLMYRQDNAQYVAEIFSKIVKLWEEGVVKPVIDSTWAYEDVTEAMQKMHDRKNIGKILMDPNEAPKLKPSTPVKGKKSDSEEKKDSEMQDDSEVKEKSAAT
ncbi:hypothetical protein GE061_000687 [Apolygus lucorum]|uniref:Enoyl reductase (ER) domain-containing protein n=1 Tax=Apolygus lucorum TaxID=248454 RepID=A0A6A4KJM2_APOLU|nr:hypothetical protein GE061_000687 [Apolygus lucorum]